MSSGLLDTSVLIAPIGADLSSLPPTAAISVISLGELRAGVLLARDERIREERRQRLEAVTAVFLPLVVDTRVAEQYGRLLALARSAGRLEKATDLLILATAAATARTLYTRDLRQAQLAEAADIPVATVST